MRYSVGLVWALALGVMGCSETSPNLCEGVDCDDDNHCTYDVCDPATGSCEHFGNCDCVDCDDDNACTDDVCDFTTGMCANQPFDDGTACSEGECLDGVCAPVGAFRCTERGIRDAIVEGGGPHYFACDGPTTVLTEAEILIDNDVVLEGEGNLTLDGNADHPLLFVPQGVTAQLHGLTITNGLLRPALINLGTLTLTDSKVVGNKSNAGGGISNEGMLTIVNSEVSGNEGPQGAGIHNLARATLILRDSTVSDNTNISPFTGGGIYNAGMLQMAGSTVSGNVADDNGGIYTSRNATSILVNATVSGNVSERTSRGGGILNHGTLVLIHSTVSGNTPPYVDSEAATITMRGNVFGDECRFRGAGGTPGSATSLGYNIESPGDTCPLDQETDQLNVGADDLKLGPLQDNGGPTETYALGAESVAIDVIPEAECVDAEGAPLTTDQRGFSRPVAILGPEPKCDVGAFEVQR